MSVSWELILIQWSTLELMNSSPSYLINYFVSYDFSIFSFYFPLTIKDPQVSLMKTEWPLHKLLLWRQHWTSWFNFLFRDNSSFSLSYFFVYSWNSEFLLSEWTNSPNMGKEQGILRKAKVQLLQKWTACSCYCPVFFLATTAQNRTCAFGSVTAIAYRFRWCLLFRRKGLELFSAPNFLLYLEVWHYNSYCFPLQNKTIVIFGSTEESLVIKCLNNRIKCLKNTYKQEMVLCTYIKSFLPKRRSLDFNTQ